MKITNVESFAVSIPLDKPISFATRTIEARDHAITRIHTEEGLTGIGYTLGYDGSGLIAQAVEELLAPMVEGEDPRDTERLWNRMFDGTVQIGRKGLLLRAIATVDIALWDLKSKDADQPLYKLLGANSDSVSAYASGGYYWEDKGLSGLADEMQRYVDEGHDVVKMKVGRKSLSEEVERVQVVRETIGPNRTLLLDANGAWDKKREALDACRAFAEYDPYFMEEPVMPDKVTLMGEVNKELAYSVASGELEFNRYGFEELLREGAVDIIQPDVTVVGGVTEFLKIVNAAAGKDIPVAPHYNWDLHVQLLAAIDNGLWAEYFYRDTNVKAFDDVLEYTLEPEEGAIQLPDRAGHGVRLDEEKVEQYRM